jgi:hypothetical protein
MLKKFAILLTLFVLSMPVLAAQNTYFSGVETYMFQNGLYPDPAYDGIELATISASNPNYNFGDSIGTYSSDTYDAVLGAIDIDEGGFGTLAKARILLKCDISALPDSFIILEAKLRLCIDYMEMGSSDSTEIALYRVLPSWTEGSSSGATELGAVCWNYRSYNTVSWVAAGCDGTYYTSFRVSRWNYFVNSDDYDAMVPAGTDTITTTTDIDRNYDPIIKYTIYRRGTKVRNRFIEFDVTEAVRNWHGGQWENNGLIMIMSDEGNSTAKYIVFFDDEDLEGLEDSTTSTQYFFRPRLTVKGILVSSTAGGRSALGGSSGL